VSMLSLVVGRVWSSFVLSLSLFIVKGSPSDIKCDIKLLKQCGKGGTYKKKK